MIRLKHYGKAAGLALLLALGAQGQAADANAPGAREAIQACLDCHDYGEDAPANQVLMGSHGIDGDAEDIAGRRGCLDCHGDSVAHIAEPRLRAPDVSFGPRWSANPATQDQRCLACHEGDSAQNWRNALHMVNNMTCITCHDIHQPEDKILIGDQQTQVCATCHKAQKTGIHDMGDAGPENPPCSLCHNPHNHEAAQPQMLANQSAGCTFCHTSDQMDTLAALNPKAGNYHRSDSDSCIDCHTGISHAAEESAPLLHPEPVHGRGVTLFFPGNANRQWLLQEHPGSQPLRQGTDCQRCHRGEEAAMGAALAGDFSPSSRIVGIAFSLAGEQLKIDLNWEGPAGDSQLALMWGEADNAEFERGGCFAACHGDDQGQAARLVFHGGRNTADATMGGLVTPGMGAELWRIPLDDGKLETALVSDRIHQQATSDIAVSKRYSDGQWSVALTIDLGHAENGLRFARENRYTFGIALHGDDNPGREHWVSLPMTMSIGGRNTDFIAE